MRHPFRPTRSLGRAQYAATHPCSRTGPERLSAACTRHKTPSSVETSLGALALIASLSEFPIDRYSFCIANPASAPSPAMIGPADADGSIRTVFGHLTSLRLSKHMVCAPIAGEFPGCEPSALPGCTQPGPPEWSRLDRFATVDHEHLAGGEAVVQHEAHDGVGHVFGLADALEIGPRARPLTVVDRV